MSTAKYGTPAAAGSGSPAPTPLYDGHGRPLEYVRLALTDRCNLRCAYCMPATGLAFAPAAALLTYAELLRLVGLLAGLGVRKVRLTGGEPFVRRGLPGFIAGLRRVPGITDISLTTNGVLTAPHVPTLARLGISAVNLSLDTLDRARFHQITRRDALPAVLATLAVLLAARIPVKINAVVMAGRNTQDLAALAELTRHQPLTVRFIEEMPFNGGDPGAAPTLSWPHTRIRQQLAAHFPGLTALPATPGATATEYTIPGFVGRVGIIAAYSRTFCGTCNRLRVTPEGGIKTCLYDQGVLDARALLRGGATDAELTAALAAAFRHRAASGIEAEKRRPTHQLSFESMATIGG